MSRVWVLEQRRDYEGGDPAGVFSSLELAKAAADQSNRYYRSLEAHPPPEIAPLVWPELDDDDGFYEAESYCSAIDWFRITPFDVDEDIEIFDGRMIAETQP